MACSNLLSVLSKPLKDLQHSGAYSSINCVQCDLTIRKFVVAPILSYKIAWIMNTDF